ncbi:hypothetical protein C8T65DRAFT_590105 [Cerioporus squamosus]|nr:hypothetical protein C8T65DRAFT_590105 [Cerioporus squamosus]
MVVVVDTDGIQELPFTFCRCTCASREDLQIIDLGLYPASVSRPRTVFTARLLDDFLLANKECNASARNYYNALRRRTNNAFPHMVPVCRSSVFVEVLACSDSDRYRELLRVSRQWRNLKMRKWAGFGHRQDSVTVSGPAPLFVFPGTSTFPS